jgi:hypothetical protein
MRCVAKGIRQLSASRYPAPRRTSRPLGEQRALGTEAILFDGIKILNTFLNLATSTIQVSRSYQYTANEIVPIARGVRLPEVTHLRLFADRRDPIRIRCSSGHERRAALPQLHDLPRSRR